MDRLKRLKAFWKRPKSIKWDFIKYSLICAVFVLIGSWAIVQICFKTATYYSQTHQLFIHEEIFDENGNMEQAIYPDNEQYYPVYYLLNYLSLFLIPPWCVLCVMVCGTVFYRRKLVKPLKILSDASEHIAANELDFSVEIPEQNELGQLCQSFETMRASLQDNYIEMWRQVEDRRRLNAAFAHDLRTPLTVLMGQAEMLEEFAEELSREKIAVTAATMIRHIVRLRNYVDTMNALQKLEDIAIDRQPVRAAELVETLRETGASVCGEKEFVFTDRLSEFFDHTESAELLLDRSAVPEVYENLLANAARFARKTVAVTVTVELSDGQERLLALTVEDDGAGFSEQDLSRVTAPFYQSPNVRENQGAEHFGMGLHICKILCEKHGGRLELARRDGGGARITAVFRC